MPFLEVRKIHLIFALEAESDSHYFTDETHPNKKLSVSFAPTESPCSQREDNSVSRFLSISPTHQLLSRLSIACFASWHNAPFNSHTFMTLNINNTGSLDANKLSLCRILEHVVHTSKSIVFHDFQHTSKWWILVVEVTFPDRGPGTSLARSGHQNFELR